MMVDISLPEPILDRTPCRAKIRQTPIQFPMVKVTGTSCSIYYIFTVQFQLVYRERIFTAQFENAPITALSEV